MGADYIGYAIPAVTLTPARQEELGRLIDGLTEAQLEHMIEYGNFDDDGDLISDEDAIAAARKQLHEALVAYGDFNDTRNVGMTRIDGRAYYVTGGLSWGDEPCEECSTFATLLECPGVYPRLAAFWALEEAVLKDRDVVEALAKELQGALAAPPRS